MTWFSRSAQTVLANANTQVLKNALRNYIKAVNNLPNKNNAHIYGLMMKTANGSNASYKNRMVNGIAKIVAASHRGLNKAVEAVANGAPEGPAAAAVNNATAKINNLNRRMTSIKNLAAVAGGPGGPTNSQVVALYKSKGYNNVANRAINTAGKYASIWAAINGLTAAELPGANIELTRNAFLPNNNSRKAKLVRNSGNSNWRFANAANNARYNINRKNKNDPVVVLKGAGAAVNKSKAAAQLLYNQSYGGRLGIGIKSGAWTVNKSVQNLTNTNNKMARFIGLNRTVVNANLNARPNKNQTQRAKAVLNAIIQKQKAVPGN